MIIAYYSYNNYIICAYCFPITCMMYEYVSKDTSSTIRPGIRRRRTGTSRTSLSRVPQNRQAGCNPTQGDPVLPARI